MRSKRAIRHMTHPAEPRLRQTTEVPGSIPSGAAARWVVAAGAAVLSLSVVAHLALVRRPSPPPLPLELLGVLGTAAAVLLIAVGVRARERARDAARRATDARRAERAGADATLARLSTVIEQHFDAWALTPAEREVARLLLRGETHKNVAKLTGRSERTVRQHAVAVYGKSDLHGRAELAGYFLDTLVLAPPASPLPEPPAGWAGDA